MDEAIYSPKPSLMTFIGTISAIDHSENALNCKEFERYVPASDGYRCECIPGYVKEGNDCIPKRTCEESPCINGGVCVEEKTGLRCICLLGYLGPNCEIRVRECQDASCMDDEICVSTETGYRCVKKDRIQI